MFAIQARRIAFGLSRPYAYKLIGSAKVNEQMSPIGDIQLKPLTESQFRELISVPEEKRVAAWRGALKLAGDKPVTAKIVRQAAAEFREKKNGKPKPVAKYKLRPAFKLISEIEKLARADESQKLLAKVADLQKYLQSIRGK